MKATPCAVLVAAIAATVTLQARGPIKIGTIAPTNSPYERALQEMCDAWKTQTGGRVTCTVFARTRGTEDTMLFGMRSHQNPGAAQLSAIPLSRLDPAFNVFGLPMFFESYAEAERVLAKLTPALEQGLMKEKLKVLNFAFAGWVHVFSKEPVRTLADLKRQPLYLSTGDDVTAKWYGDNGFKAVPLDATQMLASLKTGVIKATPAPPIFANILGWHGSAPNMMELGFAPLLGATVMSLDTWNEIPAPDQPIVLKVAREAGERLRKEIPAQEKEAIEAMKKRKLNVTKVDPAEWRNMADQLAQALIAAKLVPKDVYETAKRERDLVRAGK